MKSFLVLIFSLCLSASVITTALAAQFSDIREGSELQTMVDYLSDNNIINGYPDGTFQPERTINRAEALKIIFETIKTTSFDVSTEVEKPFSDIDKNQWFAKYVSTAKKKNIIKGYADGTFKPGQEVNRAEFIKMVMTALPFFDTMPRSSGQAALQFSDIDTQQWYVSYVDMALGMNFLRKTDRLKPTAPMQRQDAAEIIFAISNYLDDNPAALENNLYVPEESFKVVTPTRKLKEVNYTTEWGPEKLTTTFNGTSTLISNKHHGYNIQVDGFVQATGLELEDYALYITMPDSCEINVYEHSEQKNAQEHHDYYLDPENLMAPILSKSLTKENMGTNIAVYKSSASFPEPYGDTEEFIIEGKDKTYSLFARSDECKSHFETIIKGFELR